MSRARRVTMWALAMIVAIALLAGGGLWLAIRHNGPMVLDTVDRLTGGGRGVTVAQRVQYGPPQAQKLIVYRPDGPENATGPLPVLIFAHGGSWNSGDPDDYGFVARALAPKGFIVVLAGYRLGEAGRYPAMVQDTAAAIGWVRSHIAALGGDPDRIVLAGHSAGAYNVVEAALDRRWLDAAGVPLQAIRGVIGLSGPYDFHPFTSDAAQAAFGSVGAGADSQPVNHVRADAPPMLLIQGERDTLVEPRNTRALARRLAQAGVAVETVFYPEMTHTDPLLALASPWRRDAKVVDAIAAFARTVATLSVPVQREMP